MDEAQNQRQLTRCLGVEEMEVCIVDVLYLPVSSEDGHCVMISSCKLLGEPESVRSSAVICECFGISGGFFKSCCYFCCGW